MKLETLNSEKFEAMTSEKMSKVRGGDYYSTSSVVTAGTTTTPAGSNVPDRQYYTPLKNGYKLERYEIYIDGSWHFSS
ncbi:hypothetical protein [Chryseobacterium sp.]|uniref:hypothetical protein n=1 Tax=Chryseobacterium sp. TaxID=1871047 RepID=UPI0025C0CF2D|nr:hypothetical protein [Chryseobacterium sp.]